jgi:YVTN family beta-propeller protein
VDFRILGPLEVRGDEGELSLGGGKQRALLALLLIHQNELLSSDRLIEELWNEPPPTAAKIVQNYVSQLRRVLGDGRLQTQGRGYALRVEPNELDVDRFRERLEAGRRAKASGDAVRASSLLLEALALSRGPPLADFAYDSFAREEIGRLEELHLSAVIEWIDAELALGHDADLIVELETLVARHPLQERPRGQLMLALYRSGRQAEALEVYQDARRTLAEELGIEPGPALQQLENSILTHDPAIAIEAPPRQARPASPRAPSRRKWTLRRRALAAVLGAAVVVGTAAAALHVSSGDPAVPTVAGNALAIIDPDSSRVTGQVAVGAMPAALAVGESGLWVANRVDQTVSRLDLDSGEVVRSIAVGGVPTSIAVRKNAVWVVRRPPDHYPELIRIDPRFDVVEPGGRVLQGDPWSAAAVATGSDGLWVAAEAGVVEYLDPAGKVTAKIDTGNNPVSVAVGAGAVWAGDARGNNVVRIDPAGKLALTAIPTGDGASAMAVGAGAVWVAERLADAVVRIDPATNSVTTTIPVGRSPSGIAAGLGSVWVANSRDGTVSRIDPGRNVVVKTITVGGSPQAIAVGGGRVFVSVQRPVVGPGLTGGVLRVDSADQLDSLDPAVANTLPSWTIMYATCAGLFNYPDRPAPAGSRPEPEVAATLPSRSADGKTYTFTIRNGFRFSPPSNAPVTAQTFKFAIERALSPKITYGPAQNYAGDIVGVAAYEAGKTKHISGVRAHGNTLTVQLTRPAPDIVSRLAVPHFCAVPPGTPVEPRGLNQVPSAGPYYVASYTPGQGAVLKRNLNYHGSRPHALDEIDYTVGVGPARIVKEIEAGTADFGVVDYLRPAKLASLEAKYGPRTEAARAGDQRYFVNSLLGLEFLDLNASRPLFANSNLRKAVNYALDRSAIARASGHLATPTDQYLQPVVPGFRNTHVYPLTADLARARRLARGHGGRGVLYACDRPRCREVAQLIRAELAPIGIDVEVKAMSGYELFNRTGIRGEPFDMALDVWYPVYPDPADVLNYLFDGRSIRAVANSNHSYFDDPAYNRKLAAAARLTGPQRYSVYHALESDLLRNAAPSAPLLNWSEADFFSARIGCITFQPIYQIDLAALCLKRRR